MYSKIQNIFDNYTLRPIRTAGCLFYYYICSGLCVTIDFTSKGLEVFVYQKYKLAWFDWVYDMIIEYYDPKNLSVIIIIGNAQDLIKFTRIYLKVN